MPTASPSAPVRLESVVQIYTTTIVEKEQGLSLSIAAIPQAVLPGGELGPDAVAAAIEATIARELPTPPASFLPHALLALLDDDPLTKLDIYLSAAADPGLVDGSPINVSRERLLFVEHCAFAPVVPMEQSELDLKAMAAVATLVGTVVVATTVSGPVVLIVTPAAILIVGTSLVFTKHVMTRLDRWLSKRWGT